MYSFFNKKKQAGYRFIIKFTNTQALTKKIHIMKKITSLFTFFAISVGFAQPTNNAPVPTNNAADVISIYGGAFTNVATNYNPNWGQSGFCCVDPNFDPGTANTVLAYPNFNYQGTELVTQNASGMEFLHVDIWTANATVVKVSPINNGSGVTEFLVDIPIVSGGWSSVDLPKSAFVGMTWNSVFQIKFDGQAGVSPSTIYLDNVYFWKAPTPAGSDATLSSLQVDGASVAGFSSAAYSYTYDLVVGTTVVPQITLATPTDSNATSVVITQATAIPGDATVLVTSQNGNVTQTYTISFVASIPNPSPTPSTPPAEVLAIYSDTGNFTNFWAPEYAFGAFAAKPDLDLTAGVNEAIKMNFAVGYGEGRNSVTDISAYNWVHFDYFADADSNEIRFILIANNGGVTEHPYELTTAGSNGTLVKGSWQSVNIPLSFFTGIGFTKANFFQFKLGTSSDLVSKIVHFDNIYFSVNEGTVLNTNTIVASTFKVYPNPAQNEWNITATQNINSIQLFDILGKEVKAIQPNATSAKVDASELSNGVYFANITTDNGSKTVKLVKN